MTSRFRYIIYFSTGALVLTSFGAFSNEFLKVLPGQSIPAPERLSKPTIPQAIVELPATKMSAVYKISIRGIVVGTAAAGQDESNELGPSEFEMRLLSRIGASPIVNILKQKLIVDGEALTIEVDSRAKGRVSEIGRVTSHWKKRNNDIVLEHSGPSSQVAHSAAYTATKSTQEWSDSVGLLFYRPKGKNYSKYFVPLTGELHKEGDLKALYDDDGFLKEALLPWGAGVHLEISRLTFDDLPKLEASLSKGLVDFAWFPETGGGAKEIQGLRQLAESGYNFARSLEQEVTRKIPEVPYLLHRKMFNFQHLCSKVSNVLNSFGRVEGKEEQALDAVVQAVRETLDEDERELPESLTVRAEWDVLKDDSKKWQWARLVSHMITRTRDELSQTMSIEQKQKLRLQLRVNVDKLGRRSVIKGMLRPVELMLKTEIEIADEAAMRDTSLKAMPAVHNPSAPQRFEYINGQFFARGGVSDLGEICKVFDGKVGLDLGEAPQEIFRTSVARGTWDSLTRLQLVTEFARRAASSPHCRLLVVRTPRELASEAGEALGAFRKQILQTEASFQFSNGSTRKFRLVPGTYEFVASSLVNGHVLGRQQLVVTGGKQTSYNIHIK